MAWHPIRAAARQRPGRQARRRAGRQAGGPRAQRRQAWARPQPEPSGQDESLVFSNLCTSGARERRAAGTADPAASAWPGIRHPAAAAFTRRPRRGRRPAPRNLPLAFLFAVPPTWKTTCLSLAQRSRAVPSRVVHRPAPPPAAIRPAANRSADRRRACGQKSPRKV